MTANISNSTSHSNYDKIMAHLPASDCISWFAVLIPECLAIVILNTVTIIVLVKTTQALLAVSLNLLVLFLCL